MPYLLKAHTVGAVRLLGAIDYPTDRGCATLHVIAWMSFSRDSPTRANRMRSTFRTSSGRRQAVQSCKSGSSISLGQDESKSVPLTAQLRDNRLQRMVVARNPWFMTTNMVNVKKTHNPCQP